MEPVKLSDFITQSLVEIYQGIKGANKTIRGSHNVFSLRETYRKDGPNRIQFDIAVTASKTSAEAGKIGVALFNFGIGVGASEESDHKLVHRLRFEVDVEQTSG